MTNLMKDPEIVALMMRLQKVAEAACEIKEVLSEAPKGVPREEIQKIANVCDDIAANFMTKLPDLRLDEAKSVLPEMIEKAEATMSKTRLELGYIIALTNCDNAVAH